MSRQTRRAGAAAARQLGNNIAIGEIVQLKSGGSKMTVEMLEGPYATCIWHDADNRIQAAKILLTSLVVVQ